MPWSPWLVFLTVGLLFLTVGLLLHLLYPDLSDPSSLTECTSDNQLFGTSNNTASVAKHPTLKSKLD